mmetsp:Transcript_100956/g.286135  ORF Transcript_100956/g.286135 Transcript_100956/m.286135 type:complete len:306 (+) Transcript_100956:1889-2806(+)
MTLTLPGSASLSGSASGRYCPDVLVKRLRSTSDQHGFVACLRISSHMSSPFHLAARSRADSPLESGQRASAAASSSARTVGWEPARTARMTGVARTSMFVALTLAALLMSSTQILSWIGFLVSHAATMSGVSPSLFTASTGARILRSVTSAPRCFCVKACCTHWWSGVFPLSSVRRRSSPVAGSSSSAGPVFEELRWTVTSASIKSSCPASTACQKRHFRAKYTPCCRMPCILELGRSRFMDAATLMADMPSGRFGSASKARSMEHMFTLSQLTAFVNGVAPVSVTMFTGARLMRRLCIAGISRL